MTTKMKKIITGMVMGAAVFWGSNDLSAQNISSLLEQLINLEARLSHLETTQKKLFRKLHNQLSAGQFDEDAASLAHAVSALKSQMNRLILDVESFDEGNDRAGNARILNAVEVQSDETLSLLDEIMKKYPDSEEEANEVNGFIDFFNTTVQDKSEAITFEAVYTSDIHSNLAGGLRQRTAYLDNVDLSVEIDTEQLFGWLGSSFFLYALGNNGSSPTENIGDLQGVSNIDADDTWKIYEAWIQQTLFAGRFSALAGLYDLNSEFDVIETAGLFLNSSFGIGPDFAQTGLNGPSIFPTTSLGLRMKIQPSPTFYFQTVVLDGVSGNPENPSGTQIKFGSNDGFLVSAEAAFLTGGEDESSKPYSKVAVGVYHYTSAFPALLETNSAGAPIARTGRPGFYLLAEHTLLRDGSDPTQGLGIFGRIGFADSKIYQLASYVGAGLVYTGLIPGRNEDKVGLAIASAHNGRQFKQAMLGAGARVDNSETALELTYRAILTRWLTVQPDFQYIVNPGTDTALSNAFAGGARFEITF